MPLIVSVKSSVSSTAPLLAMTVRSKSPHSIGLPEILPLLKVTPSGRSPMSDQVVALKLLSLMVSEYFFCHFPIFSASVLKLGVPLLTLRLNDFDFEPNAFSAFTVNLKVVAFEVSTVPEISPVFLSSSRPFGSSPSVNVHETSFPPSDSSLNS